MYLEMRLQCFPQSLVSRDQTLRPPLSISIFLFLGSWFTLHGVPSSVNHALLVWCNWCSAKTNLQTCEQHRESAGVVEQKRLRSLLCAALSNDWIGSRVLPDLIKTLFCLRANTRPGASRSVNENLEKPQRRSQGCVGAGEIQGPEWGQGWSQGRVGAGEIQGPEGGQGWSQELAW